MRCAVNTAFRPSMVVMSSASEASLREADARQRMFGLGQP